LDPSSLFGTYGHGNLQVLWEDGERIFCRGAGRANSGGRSAVLAVFPAGEHPTPATLNRLAHEIWIEDELDGAWAVRPLELLSEGGRSMLVLEDPGGEPAPSGCWAHPWRWSASCAWPSALPWLWASSTSGAWWHKDIKPVNILVNDATGAVKFTGFGIASRLLRERQAPEPPETIAGNPRLYGAGADWPHEPLGDSRSDLYALGVTFYELLTGTLPFTAADPIELIHCHIAREPVPLHEFARAVPTPFR